MDAELTKKEILLRKNKEIVIQIAQKNVVDEQTAGVYRPPEV